MSILMLVVVWTLIIVIGLGLPTWFGISVVKYKKAKKDKTTPVSSGITVNFWLSLVGFIAWCILVLLTIAFFIIGSLIVANM